MRINNVARDIYSIDYYTVDTLLLDIPRIPSSKMLLKLVWFPHIKMLLRECQDADGRADDRE